MIHVCMSNKHNEIEPGATAETSVEPQLESNYLLFSLRMMGLKKSN